MMKKIFIRTTCAIYIVIIFTLSIGCSKAIIIPSDISIGQSNTSEGVLLISFSLSAYDQIFSSHNIFISNREYKSLNPRKDYRVSYDIREDSIRIYYEAYKLPAGEYIMRGWDMHNDGNSGRPLLGRGPSSQFHIPFTVFAGKVNYIGDYLAIVTQNKNLSGSQIGYGGYFVVSRRLQKDLPIVEKRFPKLNLVGTLNCVPDFTAYNKKYTGIFVKGINTP